MPARIWFWLLVPAMSLPVTWRLGLLPPSTIAVLRLLSAFGPVVAGLTRSWMKLSWTKLWDGVVTAVPLRVPPAPNRPVLLLGMRTPVALPLMSLVATVKLDEPPLMLTAAAALPFRGPV